MENEIDGACSMQGTRNANQILFKNVKEKNSLGDLGVDGRIILKWTLK
jgi:hypothetical protein